MIDQLDTIMIVNDVPSIEKEPSVITSKIATLTMPVNLENLDDKDTPSDTQGSAT